ncbi:MAG TPA: ABC transporter permease [Chitinophagales bacterium]|jgi:lipopolysaccharide transport system permease protein|nr:ABC transporter permease [Chitinophagales bacterium]HQW77917.1 ABC transporter permease [Chitinophagales bacterium]
MYKDTKWVEIIDAKSGAIKNIWIDLINYSDLILMLVKRDFVVMYKQTILGPLWYIIQPILSTLIFVIIFGNLAKIPTDGIPPILFYLSGVTIWGYFSDCFTKTATVFVDNAALFGKVYFPRIVMPVSIIVSNLLRFFIQLSLFILVYIIYIILGKASLPNAYALLLPLLILLMGMLSLGLGIIFSALTTKYKDLRFLMAFGIQLAMYITPVILPLSTIPKDKQFLFLLNPMTGIIECFRKGFLHTPSFEWYMLGYSFIVTVIILFLGVFIFNKIEKDFVDTV